jgi:uncharacterized protein YjdB
MKKKLIKCVISLGLFLFMTFIVPDLTPNGVGAAYATNVEKEKSDDYRLNLRSITLVKGKTFPLKAYNLGENAKVTFKSADSEIASVSEDGTITAKMIGFTTVTASIKDGLNTISLNCDVTVGPPAFSIKMTRSRIILGVDKSDSVSVIMKPSNTAEDPGFSSYDDSIASISSGGRATGKKVGLTYLFAAIDALNSDGKQKYATCSVIVVNPDDVLPLETYFSDHIELSMIPEADLNSALADYFNSSAVPTPTPAGKATETLVESLDKYLNGRLNLAALRKDLAAK